jgi:glycosyltransferase involved in cell wall biosynthesis
MRILFITQGYLPALGGTELYMRRIAEELARLGKDTVTVFTTDGFSVEGFADPAAPRMPTGETDMGGVRVRRFAVARRASWLLRWPQAVAYRLRLPLNDRLRTLYQGPIVPGLARAIRAHPADVVSASSFPLLHMYTALHAAHASGRPCVLHGAVHPGDRWGYDRPMLRRALRAADGYLCNTEYEERWAIAQGARTDAVRVVPPGVDAEAIAGCSGEEARARLGLGAGPVVGFIGQFGGHKGLGTLLEAMAMVWGERPDAQLLLAGARTRYAPRLAQAVTQLPETHRAQVILRYDFAESDKPLLYNAIDVLASSSGFESFGITFLEAWAAGKPVIGCRGGAVEEVVRDGQDGLLVEYSDAGGLAKAILMLLNRQDIARRMGDTGRKKVRDRYSWTRAAGAYREALVQAVSRESEVR